jgi:glycosyltransferase involved in cell wall biosynthesis
MTQKETPRSLSLFLPQLSMGGAEKMAINLLNEWESSHLDIELVLGAEKGPLLEELSSEISVHSLKFNTERYPIIFCANRLGNYINTTDPDLMLSFMYHANITTLLSRRLSEKNPKVIVSERNHLSSVLESLPTYKRLAVKLLQSRLYPSADHIIPISEGVAHDLKTHIGVNKAKVSVVYNPVVTDQVIQLSKEDVEEAWFNPTEDDIVLAAGRLHPQKDFKTLIQAFDKVYSELDCKLVILGEGDQRSDLEELIHKLDLEEDVHLPGRVNNPYKYMRQASVFVLSSRWEGFGNVIVESLACGCPVVSTDCPSGPREILDGGEYGELTPMGDPSELADAIIQTIESPVDEDRLRCRSDDFHVDTIADEYLKIINSVYRGEH